MWYFFKPSQLLTLLALICLVSYSHGYTQLDKTVAIVEDNVILQSQVDERLLYLQLQNPEITETEQLRGEILDQLIIEELQLRIANRVRIPIPPAEIESVKNKLVKQLSDKGESFDRYLQQRQLTEKELEQEIVNNLKIQKVQQGSITQRLKITEREIDEFLESKAGTEWLKTRYRLGHILLPINDNNEATVVSIAQQLMAELRNPDANFGELAARYSKGPNAQKGGDLGWREKSELPGLFIEQVANLQLGDIATPFRSNAGIHILKLINRSGAEPVIVKRYKARHILIKPTELFTDAEAKAKADSLYQRLLAGEDFIELAKEYTEDTGSKNSGGDLGWSAPGQFVPEFERTMKATPVGNISEPFRSQFGWHILRVDDTKTEDMFETVKRNQVANILKQRRFNDELQLWIQELRENACVEVLI